MHICIAWSLLTVGRNSIGDSLSREVLVLCEEIFSQGDMMRPEAAEADGCFTPGGCAIATSYVGLVHPLSAGLSVTFGTPHCLANCIVMRAMEEFYPQDTRHFGNGRTASHQYTTGSISQFFYRRL